MGHSNEYIIHLTETKVPNIKRIILSEKYRKLKHFVLGSRFLKQTQRKKLRNVIKEGWRGKHTRGHRSSGRNEDSMQDY